jgi:hypothetical protein
VTALFWQFSYLQVLDLLTTVAFLVLGVREGNPLVRMAIENSSSPLIGLVTIKAVALGLGLFCLATDKRRLLERINLLFALVVAWNLIALIIGATHHMAAS